MSLLTTVEGHQALEVGLVGREGMVGVSQGTGTAMRMNSARFRKEFRKSLIRILDRKGLEAASCRCYEVVKDLQGSAQTV